MIKAILLDLDDTLLNTNMERFLPQYFEALGNRLNHFLPAKELIPLVLKSTGKMINNTNPDQTNQQVFESYFFAQLKQPIPAVKEAIKDFYEDEFPKLKKYTTKIPVAADFVAMLLNRGYKIVLATNPLFPLRAIEHRMQWAGLDHVKFNLITAYENSHYCKPNPLYYQEILDKLEIEARETIMIGDDFENDILPARAVGIYTFQVGQTVPESLQSGELVQCMNWFHSADFKTRFENE